MIANVANLTIHYGKRAAVDGLKAGDAIVLQVERDAELLYVTLRIEK